MKRLMIALALLAAPLPALAQDQGAPADGAAMMKKQMSLMTPEMRQRVQALSPETQATLRKLFGAHTRVSETATMRQVMVEIMSDLQAVIAGLSMGNGEQAASAARAIANHRIPRGGILPYLEPDLVSDEMLSSLTTFNAEVEGNARTLAAAAAAGDLAEASAYLDDITQGCVACHDLFRGRPGVSSRVVPTQ